MTKVQENMSIEHKEMLKYCQNIINVAPENSIEHKIAKLALIQLNKEHLEIVELCQEIKQNSDVNTPQNKIAHLVLSQYDKSFSLGKEVGFVPNGWKLVPVEPVRKMFMFVPSMARMKINHDEYDVSGINEKNAKWIYEQMLKNAPEYK